MKSDSRRQGIMDFLMDAGTASVEDLASRFSVSKMTVHRDLDELEESGFLRKVRGGASIQPSGLFESDFRYRQKLAGEEKRRLAKAAAAMIEPGQTVIIDDGSTAGSIAAHLAELRPLTVITNNLAVIQELAPIGGITLIALGGQYSKKFHGFFGLLAEETLRSLRADVAFLSSSAIHGASAFHQEQEVVQTKRLMMAAAARKYLLVDHGKFGRTALHFLTELKTFDTVFTGGELGPPAREVLEAAGVSLTVVDDKD
ncbi:MULTISPECIES: DeoR/GlpR family DNA-binding transcription regulator [unclassified Mesorhizobium]|uniref:DeoR/GlpR family DNA-binding transcription regulator n=1 Tax=unclassified Mesorhizobium TaxID=325217 RepID=UPI000BB02DA6|nr:MULTISPECIES: DeoR/GlpR family DNA-binding transcription regulator [unclassified Mesorhizobium]TGT53787.1 DeoR/GlpR transcriptional regulator [Mesorhizobium sp. M00.F.Ca.ET.170.01.1.1]AZO09785.1 DeoR/GlpR transcriptional regulator [Mesorhizobium sp. M3A.F.Ca.ET.080.04.2.1]PBB85275.1 DeoR family transcriptional regulator [Mesorhizobium sp. WSM3876]RWE27476.1 MAG: DeoR/GlpR transcriptional regulator [Mesorhizobium sp.]RWF20165.1 MAG: DeoR/GlpR transcriptional regulator [Mesorhizobium sp.]